MARTLKVWGSSTDIDFLRYDRVIVAAPSKGKAITLVRTSRHNFDAYWTPATEDAELRVATEEGVWARLTHASGKVPPPTFTRLNPDHTVRLGSNLMTDVSMNSKRADAPYRKVRPDRPVPQRTFSNFSDYWSYAKEFTDEQRSVLLSRLSAAEQSALRKSYVDGGWEDVFLMNDLEHIADSVKAESGQDLFAIRHQVLRGRRVFVNRKFWDDIRKKFASLAPRTLVHLFGGFRTVTAGPDEYELVVGNGKRDDALDDVP